MIGIFDSGVGGLTVLRQLRARLPSADILYFGDTKHAPYGVKSREELSRLTVEAIERLTRQGATSILSACNSVSASLAVSLFDTLSVTPDRLIEMVGPTVASLKETDGRILVCATPATIESQIYEHAFRMVGKEVLSLPIAPLAGAIERAADDDEVRALVSEALGSVTEPYDLVVLSCTHYPLVRTHFEAVLGAIPVIDPADVVAARVEERWWPREVGNGMLSFQISEDSVPFRNLVARLFPNERYTIEVVE